MQNIPAIGLSYEPGKVQIYIDGVLRLEAPWNGPKGTIETDRRLKSWASSLVDDSDESADNISGAAGLIAQGFEQDQDNVWRHEELTRKPRPRAGDRIILSDGTEVEVLYIEQGIALYGERGAIPIHSLVPAADQGANYWRVDPKR